MARRVDHCRRMHRTAIRRRDGFEHASQPSSGRLLDVGVQWPCTFGVRLHVYPDNGTRVGTCRLGFIHCQIQPEENNIGYFLLRRCRTGGHLSNTGSLHVYQIGCCQVPWLSGDRRRVSGPVKRPGHVSDRLCTVHIPRTIAAQNLCVCVCGLHVNTPAISVSRAHKY